jgi:hypothetical protein
MHDTPYPAERRDRGAGLFSRVVALLGMTLASLVTLAGLGVAFYGSFLRETVTVTGFAPYEVPGLVIGVLGLLVAAGGFRLVDAVKGAYEDAVFDPVDDFLILVSVVWYGGLAALAVGVAIVVL